MKLPYEDRNPGIIVKKSKKVVPCDFSTDYLLDNGLVVINKPKNPTSHQISGYVKEVLHIKTAGHSGTLDPIVTGVLPVALNNGTKLLQALLSAGKEYVCYMRVHKDVGEEKIREVCAQFVGNISQLPPVKSAIKRQYRLRKIYYIDILEIDGQDVLFRVGCQAGTYIRKLCTDIGVKLGCGAHMQQLVRSKVACFSEKHMVTLQDLKDAYDAYKSGDDQLLRSYLVAPVDVLAHVPKIWIENEAIYSLSHGAQLAAPGVVQFESDVKKGSMVAVMSLKNEVVLLAEALVDASELQNLKKGIITKTLRVIINDDVYPKS